MRKTARSLVSRFLTSAIPRRRPCPCPGGFPSQKVAFHAPPSLHEARSFHRGVLQESCPEFEIPSGPENGLIDASTGQILRVHERLIISSSANNSGRLVARCCSYFLIRRFYRQFYGRPGGYVEFPATAKLSNFVAPRSLHLSILNPNRIVNRRDFVRMTEEWADKY